MCILQTANFNEFKLELALSLAKGLESHFCYLYTKPVISLYKFVITIAMSHLIIKFDVITTVWMYWNTIFSCQMLRYKN